MERITLSAQRSRLRGADTLATTYTLAQGIQKMGGADLIFCGEESSDAQPDRFPPACRMAGHRQITLIVMSTSIWPARLARGGVRIRGGHEIWKCRCRLVVSSQDGFERTTLHGLSHQSLGI